MGSVQGLPPHIQTLVTNEQNFLARHADNTYKFTLFDVVLEPTQEKGGRFKKKKHGWRIQLFQLAHSFRFAPSPHWDAVPGHGTH
ncbi:MAG: hypothetical protein AAFS07_18945 [Pseudomonadota bacterium]